MDTRTSAMVVGLYLAGIGVVAAIGWAYYAMERRSEAPRAMLAAVVPTSGASRGASNYQAPSTYYQSERAKSDQTLRQLRVSLAENQKLLEQRNQALSKKNAECQVLKTDLEQSFKLILSLLVEESNTTAQRENSAGLARNKLESELARLLEALNQAETLSAEQAQQLARLRSDLLQADMEFSMMREQAEMEVAALLGERTATGELVNSVLARCGAVAVPIVAERLEDEQVEIRRWAARTLGVFGPDAASATALLRRSLTDPDATVRDEARQSLAILDGEEIVTRAGR